jgi:hypothetical protein
MIKALALAKMDYDTLFSQYSVHSSDVIRNFDTRGAEVVVHIV